MKKLLIAGVLMLLGHISPAMGEDDLTIQKRVNAIEEIGGCGNKCDLRRAQIIGTGNQQKKNLRVAVLTGADFTGATLTNVDLRGADLRGAAFGIPFLNNPPTYLTNVDLRGADMRGVIFNGANFNDVDLRGADLRGAELISFSAFNKVQLDGANFLGADLQRPIQTNQVGFQASFIDYWNKLKNLVRATD